MRAKKATYDQRIDCWRQIGQKNRQVSPYRIPVEAVAARCEREMAELGINVSKKINSRSDVDVAEIVSMSERGLSQRNIASRLGCSQSLVGKRLKKFKNLKKSS